MAPNAAIFAPLFVASVIFFAWSLQRRLSLVTLGRPEERFTGLSQGLRQVLVNVLGQKRVLARPAGILHFIFFWACILLGVVNVEFIVAGMFPQMTLAISPDWVYLPVRAVSDVASALAVAAVAVAVVRRLLFPPYPEARNLESFVIIGAVGLHMVAYLGIAATEIALGQERAGAVMPVASFLSGMLQGESVSALETLHGALWWLHAGALLLFITILIPFSKHLHVLTSIANCFLTREGNTNIQEREEFVAGNTFGVGQVDRFTWKDLLDGFACTKCGRCQESCPASVTGKPMSPRLLIESIRTNLLANGASLRNGESPVVPLIGSGEKSVGEDAVWSCTTCGACMENCPVFIEHLPKFVGLRRHLVEMESRFPEELLNLFENMEQRSNPWGIAPSERTKWCSQLSVQPFEAGKTEYLLFVGCAGSFDSRQKHVTVSLATLLDEAGVSYGILGKDEKCCGDSLRRLGNEYVFDRMARENVEMFRQRGVQKVVTACPHCFSTLKNDYRQYGIELEVIHHGELLEKLIAEGKLQPKRKVSDLGKVAFHDSCYLGRHNNIYDAPRQVIAAATGEAPAELERKRENAFCCGGGGGRMWLEEHQGQRINHNRVEEVLRHNPDTICVSCPYCLTMFEDGLKDKQASQTKVRDIAEVLAEGFRPAL